MAAADSLDYDKVCSKFSVENLTEPQKKVLRSLYEKKDVFMSIKTGGGKSLCYQAFPVICESRDPDTRVLVISPLNSIMEEQSRFLTELGFTASYIGKNNEDDIRIAAGEMQFVFTSPENLLAVERWRTWLDTAKVDLLVVDEAHTVILWSESGQDEPFRKWFGNIGEARCMLSCPILVLTATASRSKRLKLHKKLSLVECVDIIDSPDRTNVKLFSKVLRPNMALEDVFQWLLNLVTEKKEMCPRHIVFTTIKMCGSLFSMFRRALPSAYVKHVQMFHSVTPEVIKQLVRDDMNNIHGDIRLLLASSAAGMGVNYKGIHNIIHFGPPKDMDSFLQQIGRAGRDGEQSFQVLLYNGRHIGVLKKDKKCSEMLTYVTNKQSCRREVILECYQATKSAMKAHLCCDICSKSCACGDSDCTSFDHPSLQVLDDEEDQNEADLMWDTDMSDSSPSTESSD